MPETKTTKPKRTKFKPGGNQVTSVRTVNVPDSLIGAPSTKIRAWAREMLNGQEARFRSASEKHPSDFEKISRGELKTFDLRPVRPGFFAPDGTFVEANNENIESAADIAKSNKEICAWIDKENELFNKTVTRSAESSVYELWKHGKRISDYVKESGIDYKKLKSAFEKRITLDKHYDHNARDIAKILYQWKPNAKIEEPIFQWTWGTVYALCRTRDPDVRSYWEYLIATHLKSPEVSHAHITWFLRNPNKNHDIWVGEHADELEKLRTKILNKEKLDDKEIQNLVSWLKTKRKKGDERGEI